MNKLNDDLLIIKSMIEDLDYDIHEPKKEKQQSSYINKKMNILTD